MTDRTFLGMQIVGEAHVPSNRKGPQLSDEEISTLIHNVLESPVVMALGWDQYTPYYNDGEPCTFRVGEPSLALACEDPDEYAPDYGWQEYDSEENARYWFTSWDKEFKNLVGDTSVNWTGEWPDRVSHLKTPIENAPNPILLRAYVALKKAMDIGSCDDFLLRTFGDHAIIIIDKDSGKVIIDEYEHD